MTRDKFNELKELLKRLPTVEPPGDFTVRLAEKIKTEHHGNLAAEAARQRGSSRPFADLEQGSSCPFWFIMAGVCYLLLGILLLFGLGRLENDLALAGWIAMQPQIAMVVGVIFMVFGLLLFRGKLVVLKAAQCCLFLYIFFVVANGIGMQVKLGVPATVGLLVFYIGCGVGLGFFLNEAVSRYQQHLKYAA